MASIPVGAAKVLIQATGGADSAAAIGNTGVDAVSTVAIIALIEECCGRLLREYVRPEHASVGTIVNIVHRSAAPLGAVIEVTVTVSAVTGRRVSFDIVCRHGERIVMDGTHERAIVDLARFLSALPEAG